MLPEIRISDQFVFSTYFVYIGLLYTFLVYWVYRCSNKQNLNTSMALNLALIIMVVGFIGARLAHVIWEAPQIYSQHPSAIFKFWLGGFVFYGGALPAVLACLVYLKKQKQSLTMWLDFFAPIGALGYGLGRISCLLAGCCYGSSCDLPWAIGGKHPTQAYATVWELSVFVYLNIRSQNFFSNKQTKPHVPKNLKPGQLFAEWIALHAIGRMVMEYYRDDFRGDMILGISISTWISLLLFSAAVAGLWKIKARSS